MSNTKTPPGFLANYQPLNIKPTQHYFSSEEQRQKRYAFMRKVYAISPTNKGIDLSFNVEHGLCVIRHTVNPAMYNTAQVMHGMYFFKLVDEAAHGAALSLCQEGGLATTNLSLNLIRPATTGNLTAYGRIISHGKLQYVAEAVIYNEENKVVGTGQATFMRSKTLTTRFIEKHGSLES